MSICPSQLGYMLGGLDCRAPQHAYQSTIVGEWIAGHLMAQASRRRDVVRGRKTAVRAMLEAV
jgi:hypothetical protein